MSNYRCNCVICSVNYQLTDDDYEYSFITKHLESCYKNRYSDVTTFSLHKKSYTINTFTPEQKRYLKKIYNLFPYVGKKTDFKFINIMIIKLKTIGHKNQVITPLKITIWFKNQRYRHYQKKKKLIKKNQR